MKIILLYGIAMDNSIRVNKYDIEEEMNEYIYQMKKLNNIGFYVIMSFKIKEEDIINILKLGTT